jgi:hypothetical protein
MHEKYELIGEKIEINIVHLLCGFYLNFNLHPYMNIIEISQTFHTWMKRNG